MTSTELVRPSQGMSESQAPDVGGFLDAIDAAKAELDRATTTDDLVWLMDRAMAAEVYSVALHSREAEKAATALRLRAERAAGGMRRHLPRVAPTLTNPLGARRKRALSDEQVRLAEDLRKGGMSLGDVAKQLGVSRPTITKMQRLGWKYPDLAEKESDVNVFDVKFGISRSKGQTWQRVASIPDDDFESLMSDAFERDLAVSCQALYARFTNKHEVLEAPNIFRRPDGKLVLRWHKQGIRQDRKLTHGDLDKAKIELAVARGKLSKRVGKAGTHFGDAFNATNKALEALGRASVAGLDDAARRDVDQARLHLHKAHDHLLRTLAFD